ncbi:hypothetical protein BJX96DRAFT_166990 [Aspergillus floccosus]
MQLKTALLALASAASLTAVHGRYLCDLGRADSHPMQKPYCCEHGYKPQQGSKVNYIGMGCKENPEFNKERKCPGGSTVTCCHEIEEYMSFSILMDRSNGNASYPNQVSMSGCLHCQLYRITILALARHSSGSCGIASSDTSTISSRIGSSGVDASGVDSDDDEDSSGTTRLIEFSSSSAHSACPPSAERSRGEVRVARQAGAGGDVQRRLSVHVLCKYIGALVDQQSHDVVPGGDGLVQGRAPKVIRDVDVRAALDQKVHHLSPALLRRLVQRRLARVVRHIDVHVGVHQHRHDLPQPGRDGKMQRRIALLRRHAVARCHVHLCARLQQKPRHAEVAVACRDMQTRQAARIAHVDFGALLKQHLEHAEAALGAVADNQRKQQRPAVLAARRVDVRALAHEVLDDLDMAHAPGLVYVDFRPVTYELLHYRQMAVTRGIPKRRQPGLVAVVDVNASRAQQHHDEFLVAAFRGAEQRTQWRLAQFGVLGVYVDQARGQQQTEDLAMAGFGGPGKCAAAVLVAAVNVNAGCVNDLVDDGVVAFTGGEKERNLKFALWL